MTRLSGQAEPGNHYSRSENGRGDNFGHRDVQPHHRTFVTIWALTSLYVSNTSTNDVKYYFLPLYSA